jgi:hypothetical protein
MAVVITSNIITGAVQLAVPLRNPRLMYESHYRTGTVTASGEASAEFTADNATLDPATWNFWRADAMPASLEVELAQAAPADYLLLAAHTLGTEQATVVLEHWDGGLWTEIHQVLPGNDRVLVVLFDEVTDTKFRVRLTGATVPSIGVVQLGKALAMPVGVTRDHGPITLQRRTRHETSVSGTGQFLGRSVLREGVATNITFGPLAASFVRDEFQAFVDHARADGPFGWAWNADEWPAEVAYVWAGADVTPAHAGLPGDLNVAFDVEGLLD